MNEELWLPVAGYEERYEVSNYGRVRNWRTGRIIKHFYKNGYLIVSLWKPAKQKTFFLHLLVARAFIGSKPEGYECHHRDHTPSNPRADNLEYVTPSTNVIISYQFGHRVPTCGESINTAKLDEQRVILIRKLYAEGVVQTELAARFGVNQPHISAIVLRKSWKHI